MIFGKLKKILSTGSLSPSTNLFTQISDIYTDSINVVSNNEQDSLLLENSYDYPQNFASRITPKRNLSTGSSLNTIETFSKQKKTTFSSETSDSNEIHSEYLLHKFNKRDINVFGLHHDHNTRQIFRHLNHFSNVLEQLNTMRVQEQMCDVTLVLEGEMISCHKYVLSANSPYFLSLFTNGLMETDKKVVEIKEIDPNSLRLLIDYMYTGEIAITEENVQLLLSTSNHLQLNIVKSACSQFIETQLDVTNCLGIREFAERHFCPVLLNHAEAFIEQFFKEIVLKDEFYNLNKEQLINLISKDHISVNSELVIFKSVLRWVNIDKEKRKPYLSDILKHIRFPLLNFHEIYDILDLPVIKESSQCIDLIKKGLRLKEFTPTSNESTTQIDLAFIRPRIPLGLPRTLIIFGGQAPKATSDLLTYDFRLQEWQKLPDMAIKRCRAGCVILDDRIYLIGGFNGQTRIRTVEIFDTLTSEWISGVSMNTRRGTLGVCNCSDKIYAIGGYDGVSGLESAECFNPLTKTWSMICKMSTKRSSVGVVSLNNYVYAIGGYCGDIRQCLDSVERYDPTGNEWTMMASMKRSRSGASVNVFEGKIYVAGGHDGPLVHSSVECYDPEKNKWSLITEMNTCRRNAAFIINNGLFYVIGGDDGNNILSSVEIYNIERNIWSFVPSYLAEPRSYMCSLVIDNH